MEALKDRVLALGVEGAVAVLVDCESGSLYMTVKERRARDKKKSEKGIDVDKKRKEKKTKK
ncbi:hypothetical protein AALP_AA8G353200 [Arabis alpina]|uniref:Uncharacterized protein n=1 Tax=Arabis alpina TaxID=50452 RepID=A0A087GBG8_ARAAL|nr:hypothetical protein AALP_AA8G353200 [Arabis alpina]